MTTFTPIQLFDKLDPVADDVYVALGLQGGGARGPYQAGAYRAMHEHGIEVNIVAGISIGAINGAIIAGNRPEDRLAKLAGFWKAISRSKYYNPFFLSFFPSDITYAARHRYGVFSAVCEGVSGFFKPWRILPWLAPHGSKAATSYYDTSELRDTLLKFVDFEWLNSIENPCRYKCGAVKVRTGELVFFDSKAEKITPEHVMASGALPPAFPGIVIDGFLYWDGGCHSNDVIDAIHGCGLQSHTQIYLPTLFSMEGNEPTTLEEVEMRMKEIRFGSRYRSHVQNTLRERLLRNALAQALKELSEEKRERFGTLVNMGRDHALEIICTNYKAPPYEGPYNDTDFDSALVERRADEGYHDMRLAIDKRAA